jgi:hypothetical protein
MSYMESWKCVGECGKVKPFRAFVGTRSVCRECWLYLTPEERDKHKAYMRRKKREKTERTKEKFEILDRAKSGYYTNNPEPEFLKNRKIDKNNKILNYVRAPE